MVHSNRHLRAWRVLLAAASIVVMSGSSASIAADRPAGGAKAKPVTTRAAARKQVVAATPGSAGMRVAIDPVTGLLIKPTLDQRHVLGVGANVGLERSSEGLVILTLPDGTQLCHLEGRFQEYVVARKDAEGNVRTDCVESLDLARRLQAMPVAAKPGHVRRDEASRVKE